LTTYTLSEEAIYDLMATAIGMGLQCAREGAYVPDRDAAGQIARYGLPPHSLSNAIEFIELGRPPERMLEFMQRDVDEALACGDVEHAAVIKESINEMKMAEANK
jgi:hypothetical protein